MTQKEVNPLIVALDVPTFKEAKQLVDLLSPAVTIFKIGSQLFTACGPMAVRYVLSQGRDVFLDLKYHDIPNTVASAVRAAVGLQVLGHEALDERKQKGPTPGRIRLLTVHIQGGEEMLKSAAEAAAREAERLTVFRPRIVGITVLTSQAKTDNIHALVAERACLAVNSGLDGVVASSQETALIRRETGLKTVIVTPGIRPAGAQAGDQKRVATPGEAIQSGSDYLVIGRPIIQASDPLATVRQVQNEIAAA